MTPTIRRFQPTDAPALAALRHGALRDCPPAFYASFEDFDAKTPAERLQWAHDRMGAPESGMWGAWLGDRLVGMVGLKREDALKARHKATVWGVYVHADGRGRGLGRKLLEAAIAHAATMPGVDVVALSVGAGQAPAMGLYTSLGFVAWGREPAALRIDGVDYDEVHMALRLA